MPKKKTNPPSAEDIGLNSSAKSLDIATRSTQSSSDVTGAGGRVQENGNRSTDYITLNLSISKRVVVYLSALVCVIAVLLGCYAVYLHQYYQRLYEGDLPEGDVFDNVSIETIELFSQYDSDEDGALTMIEFEPLAQQYQHTTNETKIVIDKSEYVLSVTDEVLTVHSFFEPLVVETMTKDMMSLDHSMMSLTGLFRWKRVNKEWENFSARQLANLFIPKKSLLSTINVAYKITDFIGTPSAIRGLSLTSNRYYPPRPTGSDLTIHRLLAMFHPTPHVHMRFAPQGAAACIRAYNDKYLDIVFRIHSEFQLNEPPRHPFWFTPAQFMGRLVITRNLSHVVHFHMKVPTDKKLNVDMEWINGPGSEMMANEVDIGFMPQMELKGAAPSHPAIVDGVDTRTVEGTAENGDAGVDNIQWKKQVTMYQTSRTLEKFFYPFKKVEYFNITYGVQEARRLNRPLHHIALWGALDDQSC